MSGTIALETQLNDPLLYMAPLPYVTRIYPYGFPVDVASDSRQVLDAAREGWGVYTPVFDTPPIRVHVLVSEGGERPPAPALSASGICLPGFPIQRIFPPATVCNASGFAA